MTNKHAHRQNNTSSWFAAALIWVALHAPWGLGLEQNQNFDKGEKEPQKCKGQKAKQPCLLLHSTFFNYFLKLQQNFRGDLWDC